MEGLYKRRSGKTDKKAIEDSCTVKKEWDY